MNPATRILNILEAVSSVPVNRNNASSERWSVALRLPHEDESKKLDDVALAQRLVALTDQVDAIQEMLESSCDAPPEALYLDYLARVRSVFSPVRIKEPWASLSQELGEGSWLTLRWAEWLIGPLERPLSDEDRSLLESQIVDLDLMLRDDSMPASLRRVLRSQVSELRDALDRYPTEGIAPLEKAVKTVTADVVSKKETFFEAARESPRETGSALERFKTAMSATTNIIEKSAKTAGSLKTLWTICGEILEKLPFK